MVKKKGSGNRFGVRIGKKLRDKISTLEARLRKNKCPFCLRNQVKRLSKGIWFCNKCKNKFTGKAYSI